MNTKDPSNVPGNEATNDNSSWIGSAAFVVGGILIGIISLGLFCYAWGLNFQDEGWSSSPDGRVIKQGPLIGSIVGTLVATILFWLGFMGLTRQNRG